MLIRSLFEPRIFRAPENDDGATFDDQLDEGLDELEDGGEEDEGAENGEGDDLGEAGDGEDEGQSGGRSESPPARQPSRAQARVETALREAREAKAELATLRAERTQGQTREQQERTAAQERERVAQMDPEQRLEYLLNKQGQQTEQRIAQLQFQMQDSADKTSFDGLCSRNPVAAKLSSQVEERLAEMRRGGTTAPRETVLRWVIGDRALAGAGRAKGKATRRADTNRTNQTTRPASGRGDTTGESRRETDSKAARAKRLDGMNI